MESESTLVFVREDDQELVGFEPCHDPSFPPSIDDGSLGCTEVLKGKGKSNATPAEEEDVLDIQEANRTASFEAFKTQSDGAEDQQEQQYHLRWSRLCKIVQVQDSNAGLMRGSIAGTTLRSSPNIPTSSDNQYSQRGSGCDEGSSRGFSVSGPGNHKTILNDVSGSAAPGKVLALIGPSGSGKTSLLNALSGRSGITSGVISVNGKPLNISTTVNSNPTTERSGDQNNISMSSMKQFVSKVAYVQQEDIFFDHLTIRDQLAYTAFLRLPQSWSRSKKLSEVDQTIRLLRLTRVQDSQIKLLSGGEQKRVNIGTELLTNPSCLLLDEPTSGLDSTSAVALVRLLQRLAMTRKKTVLMSIHQPSSGMFLSFDNLLLLAEGNVVYYGTPHGSIQYLKEHDLACPEGYNVADHWMDLLVSDTSLEEEEDFMKSTFFSPDVEGDAPSPQIGEVKSKSRLSRERIQASRRTTRQHFIDKWDADSMAQQIDAAVVLRTATEARNSHGNNSSIVSLPKKYNTSWTAQYRVLTHRALKNSRSAIFTPINMIRSALLGVVSGLLWFQLEYTERTVHDRTSYFFFTMTYWVFDSMFGALLAFPSERKVILKERASASYHLSAYFMAKTTSEAPTRLVLPLIYMCISFWMAGMSTKFSLFIYTTLISLLSVLAGEAYGLLVGASVDKMDQAMTVVTVVALTFMLLGGFYVETVPNFVDWVKYFSPFKYSFDASRSIVFDEPIPCDGSGELQDLCSNGQDEVSPEDLQEFLDIDGSLGFNVGMLIVLGLVPRYFAYLALKTKKGGNR